MGNKRLDLKSARVLAGHTQKTLAKVISVHPHTIADWEKNPGKVPISKAEEICNELEADLYIFLPDNSTKCRKED